MSEGLSETGLLARIRERRLTLFTVALLVPVALLTYLSIVSIRNDRVFIEWLQVQKQQGMLDTAQRRVRQSLRKKSRAIFATLDLSPEKLADPELLFGQLETAAEREPLVEGFFSVDQHHKLLFPKPVLPYAPSNGISTARGPQTPSQAKRVQSRKRVEAAIVNARQRHRRDAGQRIASLQAIAASETSGTEPWGIALFEAAQELQRSHREQEALALYKQLRECREPVRRSDGAPLRLLASLESVSSAVRREKNRESYRLSSQLVTQLMAGRFSETGRDRFWKAFKRGLSVARESSKRQGHGTIVQFSSLLAKASWFQQNLKWKERVRSELATHLSRLSPDPSPSGDPIRFIAIGGERPFLLAYRACVVGAGAAHLFVGFQIQLDAFVSSVIEPEIASMPVEPGLSLALLGKSGNLLARAGSIVDAPFEQQLGSSAVLAETLEAMPMWQLAVRRDASLINRETTRRMLLSAGLILAALVSVGFGVYTTLRFVRKSLELTRLKADFMSNITHELKTPLTSIQMFSEMLSLGRVKEERKAKYYDHINRESIKLRQMIDEILDFARSESGKVHYVLAPTDLCEVVDEALELFRHGAEIEGYELNVEVPEPGSFPPVAIDRAAMARVVINLISNAAKYSPEGPVITVSVVRNGEELCVAVKDQGIGIDPKNLSLIFDKFFREGDPLTREVSGTGLGLSLVESIVAAHGGRIDVESRKSQGSTFTVILPIAPEFRSGPWPRPTELADEITESDLNPILGSEAELVSESEISALTSAERLGGA